MRKSKKDGGLSAEKSVCYSDEMKEKAKVCVRILLFWGFGKNKFANCVLI